MISRFMGLVPVLALAAVGAAQAQSTGGGGQMAYPDSLPTGQVRIPSSTAPDTGNMAYPASPGGVTAAAPTGRDVGNMAVPAGGSSLATTSTGKPSGKRVAAAAPDGTAASPSGMAAANAMDHAPSPAPVPYVNFLPPEKPTKGVMMHHSAVHKVTAKPEAAPAAK